MLTVLASEISSYGGAAVALAVAVAELQPKKLAYDRADRLSGPLIATSVAAVAIVSAATRIGARPALELGGLGVLALACALRRAARLALDRGYSYTVRPLAGELETRGPYRHVRHPAYLGTCLYALAAPLYFASLVGLALAPLVLASVVYRIRLEEALLEETTRTSYTAYKRRTWALVPFLY